MTATYCLTCASSHAICVGRIHKHPWLVLYSPNHGRMQSQLWANHASQVLARIQTGHKLAITSALRLLRIQSLMQAVQGLHVMQNVAIYPAIYPASHHLFIT